MIRDTGSGFQPNSRYKSDKRFGQDSLASSIQNATPSGS